MIMQKKVAVKTTGIRSGAGFFQFSYMGVSCLAIFVVLSAVFFGTRVQKLIDANTAAEPIVLPALPSTIVSNEIHAGLSSSEIFDGEKQDFFLAAALSDWSYIGGENLQDPTYGRLIFTKLRWGENPDTGLGESIYTALETHLCTAEELNLSGRPNVAGIAFPTNAEEKSIVSALKEQFTCIDRGQFELNGNWDTNQGQVIGIQFEKCTNRQDCRSENEIDYWLRQKHVTLLTNQVRLDSQFYGEGKLVKESRLTFVQAANQNAVVPFHLHQSFLRYIPSDGN